MAPGRYRSRYRLAGGKPPADRAYDGVDLLPYLTGKKKTASN